MEADDWLRALQKGTVQRERRRNLSFNIYFRGDQQDMNISTSIVSMPILFVS